MKKNPHTSARTSASPSPPRVPEAMAWGLNNRGQLGDGTTSDSNWAQPILLPNHTALMVGKIEGGDQHSIGLSLDKTTVYAWGANDLGQLGNGTTKDSTQPVEVALSLSKGATIVDISAGHYHNLALDSTGQVHAWGLNSSGQLGDGTTSNRTTPVPVLQLTESATNSIAAGGAHSLAYDNVESRLAVVYGWGSNQFGQLGDGTNTDRHQPVTIETRTMDDVVLVGKSIAAGDSHSLLVALVQIGYAPVGYGWDVMAWGWNRYGQLGDGTTADRHQPVVVQHSWPGPDVPGTFPSVTAGYQHSLMIGADGTVSAWGRNDTGQLGDGTTSTRTSAVPVRNLPSGVSQIAAGGHHSLAIAGQLYGWGGNNLGQLGDGTNEDHTTPQAVGPLLAVSIGAGGSHTLLGSP